MILEGTLLAGKYRVERLLGAGGMGYVVSAIHEQLDQRVAVKLLAAGWLARHQAGAGRLVGAWAATVVVLAALLVWMVPPALAPTYGVVLGVVLFIPLARRTAAPLALAWNRHR